MNEPSSKFIETRAFLVLMIVVGMVGMYTVSLSPAHASYNCQGQPYNSYTADRVCHSLAITTTSTSWFEDGALQFQVPSMTCNACDGYVSDEVKLTDNNFDWVEVGVMTGKIGECGGPGSSNSCTFGTSFFWSDSRPNVDQGWNFHWIKTTTGQPFEEGKTANFLLNVDASVYNLWHIGIGTSDWSFTGQSINDSLHPISLQYGSMLNGTTGLTTQTTTFTNRYAQLANGGYVGSNGVDIGCNYTDYNDYPLRFVDLGSQFPQICDFTVSL